MIINLFQALFLSNIFALDLYHASNKKNYDDILKNGLRNSANGRLGPGVYTVFKLGQAIRIGEKWSKMGPGQYDIWKVKVDQSDIITKGRHPPWLELSDFQEVLLDQKSTTPERLECVSPDRISPGKKQDEMRQQHDTSMKKEQKRMDDQKKKEEEKKNASTPLFVLLSFVSLSLLF